MAAKKFELGLVMAGAISAGAYTAGVLDFLIEALEAWEKEKERNKALHGDDHAAWEVPWHDVVIKAMSGASAGGMCAAITASAIGGEIVPIRNEQDAQAHAAQNKLYKPWVVDVQMLKMLDTKDIDSTQKVFSLLDSTVIKDIADDCIDNFPVTRKRKYFDDHLQVFLTLSNLRGVPYRIPLNGESGNGHVMYHHADYCSFEIAQNGERVNYNHLYIPFNTAHADFAKNREVLKNAAMATGAFPIGLAPRKLSRMASEYGARGIINHPDAPQPHWPGHLNPSSFKYDFCNVDGGMCNNEPLEMVRHALSGGTGKPGTDDPEKLDKAVIMIDPFPTNEPFETAYDAEPDLLGAMPKILGALMQQAKFKVEELIDAADETKYGRYMIAPVRYENDHPVKWPIACEVLGGFGGFLCEKFRSHDFFLGRRNAQRFLTHHFAIPYEAAKVNPLLKDIASNPRFDAMMKFTDKQGNAYYRILPLVSSEVKDEAFKPEWPVGQADLAPVRTALKKRLTRIIDQYGDQFGFDIPGLVKKPLVNALSERAIEYVIKDLQKLKLVPTP